MGIAAANSNRFFNRYKGIDPVLTFAEDSNPLYRVLFRNTYKIENTQVQIGNEFIAGYDFVEVREPSIFDQRTTVEKVALVIHKVALYVIAVLATATVILPLASFTIKAIYLQKISNMQRIVREMHNVPRNAQQHEVIQQFNLRQDQIIGEANLPPRIVFNWQIQPFPDRFLQRAIPQRVFQEPGNPVPDRFIQQVDRIFERPRAIPLVVPHVRQNLRPDLLPQSARFSEFAMMRRAVSQEKIMSQGERNRRLAMIPVDPTRMKDITKAIERDKNGENARRLNELEQRRGRIALIEDRVLRERELANLERERVALVNLERERVAGMGGNQGYADRELTAQAFASLRFRIDVAHHHGASRRAWLGAGNFNYNTNYALEGAPPIQFNQGEMPHMHQNDATIAVAYEDLRVLMSFFIQDAQNNPVRNENGERGELRNLTLDQKLVYLRRLYDALHTCSPTWVREIMNVLRFISNPGINIDSIESLKEDLAKEFHDEVTQAVERANMAVNGGAHTLAGFVIRNGDRFGYTQEEINRARLDPYANANFDVQILGQINQILYPNKIIDDTLEKFTRSDFKAYVAGLLAESAESLATRYIAAKADANREGMQDLVAIERAGAVIGLSQEEAVVFDAALDNHESRDGLGMAIWIDTFYHPREHEGPFVIPKYLIIEAYRALEIFA